MITRYNNISLALGAPGFILQIVGLVIQRSPGKEGIGLVIVVLGTALLVAGLAFYALAKGRSPAWCLMGFLGLIGLIVLGSLSDLETTKKKKKKRRRRYEDEEDRDDDRPRKKRRRVDDDDDDYDDDRPRRRRRDDEEDGYEDEDRPRRRRRPDDDDDYEDEDRPKRRTNRSEDEELEEEPLPKNEQMREKRPAPVVRDTQVVQCSKCQKSLKIPATLIGKKVKCPACDGVFLAE